MSLWEAEQQKAALKHRLELSVTGYIFYKDRCNPIITRMQDVPAQFVLQANVRLDLGLPEDGLFHLYNELIGAWIKIKGDHVMTISPGAYIFFKTLDCEVPFHFDDYLDWANHDDDPHLQHKLAWECASVHAAYQDTAPSSLTSSSTSLMMTTFLSPSSCASSSCSSIPSSSHK